MHRTRSLSFVSLAVAPLLILLSIWWPVWLYYDVADLPVDQRTIELLRTEPTDARLRELERQAQSLRAHFSDQQALRQAETIAQGRIELSTGEMRRATLPFDENDYDGGTPGGALSMASLIVPDTLLRAYEISGNERYLLQATTTILAFAEFERELLTDIGNVRNDHAIAARVGVLIRFWRLYRERADFDEAVARTALQHLARCAAYLARPSHFTAATNHGVMQNIALLQAAAAFPALRDAPLWRDTANSRLQRQMAFYVNEEGVVLEHGPGYHRFGTQLIGMVLQLLDWNGLPAIKGLDQKYARAVMFEAQLRRPDGSIPRIGDTNGQIVANLAETNVPSDDVVNPSLILADATRIYMNAGYAITRRPLERQPGAGSETSHATVYWSHFPGHGHEVAAEGSFLLWAAGTDWIGNTGYWPYGLTGRTEATGWRGANAPHLRGEAATSARNTALLAYGADGRSHLLDLERTIEGGPQLRRQVVQVDAMVWLVLDSVSTPLQEPVDRLWTLAPNLVLEDLGAGVAAMDPATGWRLRMNFVGDRDLVVRRLRGSLDPFGGWVMNGPQPVASTSLDVVQEGGAHWVASVFSLIPPGAAPEASAPVVQYTAADDWSASIDTGTSHAIVVRRRLGRLLVGDGNTTIRQVDLTTPSASPLAERAVIQQALAGTVRDFHRFKPHVFYRLRLSYALAALALVSLLAWLWARRRTDPRLVPAYSIVLLGWAALAAWIHIVYLTS